MNWLYKLQRKFGRYSISNLMLYITVTMLAVYIMDAFLGINISEWIGFERELILRGQVWRVITFVFLPPASNSLFILFALYFYYFIGDSLEKTWGSFQFTVYYLCGVLGTIIAGSIVGSTGNFYLNMSLFFAFAQLFPNHQVMLFFILPIKVKYLAYVDWAFFALSLASALIRRDYATCLSIAASLVNFFIFFGPDFIDRYRDWKRYGKRRREFKRQVRDNRNDFWR